LVTPTHVFAAPATPKAEQLAPDEAEASLQQMSQYTDDRSGTTGETTGQVTSVSQLSDVQPTDWAFQALQSLVERYGCIVGYPDSTYRGNRAMTRYEFAAGLNACMDRVNELIASATADLVRKEDLVAIQKLQEEFAAELATLRGRVDALEARTTQLEAQQFSTTTKLSGEVVFAVGAASKAKGAIVGVDDDGTVVRGDVNNQAVFQNRVRLYLESSFTGKDKLYTGLASGNSPVFAIPANPGNSLGVPSAENTLTFQQYGDNDVILDYLSYEFTVGKKAQIFVTASGGGMYDYLPTTANDPINDGGDGGSGALSIFGSQNPIYYIGGGAGAGFNYKFNDKFHVGVSYLAGGASDAASPLDSNGLFNGDYAALGQLTITPTEKLTIALAYVNSYHGAGTPLFSFGTDVAFVGTSFANFPGGTGARVSANTGGLAVSYRFSPKFVLSAWGSYTNAEIRNSNVDNGEIWSYAMTFAFPDLLKKGNLGGVIVGVQPYLGNLRQLGFAGAENELPLHVEVFYRYQVNDYISVTPGLIYQAAPDQQNDNDSIMGVVRTTFTF
jgi:hypothetical protein